MVSMKSSKKKNEEMKLAEYPKEQYPYGLKIYLDNDTLKKLGIQETLEIGTELILHAKVEVCSASMRETDQGSNYSMDLQITDMELSSDNSMAKKAKTIYGG